MILLDTHIWIWWVDDNHAKLSQRNRELIQQYQAGGLGISIISCWEVAKAVEKQKLGLSCEVHEWLNLALAYPGIQLVDLTLPIVIESTTLVGFHRDPGDQIIVATARVLKCPLLTADQKILNYQNVQTLQ
jgi:PIN domain nuclease of toxin-antitoxin system